MDCADDCAAQGLLIAEQPNLQVQSLAIPFVGFTPARRQERAKVRG